MFGRPARKPRVLRTATVHAVERLTPELVRVVFTGPDLAGLPDLEFTDHYVKLLFPPAGADYTWPFDPEQIQATRPREEWPVTRTYTIRSFDRAAGLLTIDFVVHGDTGLAGPWAMRAQEGDTLGFFGPGGAWTPNPHADSYLFAGDEAALPAIAAALDALPTDATGEVYLEVSGAQGEVPLRDLPGMHVHWVHRGHAAPGQALTDAVTAAPLPPGRLCAFVHGEADMIRALRRHLFIDHAIPKSDVAISGYWRRGLDENGWQSGKQEFMSEVEAEEQARLARNHP